MSAQRLSRFQSLLKSNNFFGAIISKRENIQYLTSLHQLHPTNREAILFVTPTQVILYHSLFLTPPSLKGLNSQVMDKHHPVSEIMNTLFSGSDSANIAIEAHDLKVAELEKFKSLLPKCQFTPLDVTIQLETTRQIKSAAEIKSIQAACNITSRTMTWIMELLTKTPDSLTEIQVSRLIENHMYDLGATGLAFPSVVAFDSHSASPHHQVTKAKLSKNSVVLLDFGCQIDGYSSDMTRTFCVGTPPPRFEQVKDIIGSAYAAAITTLSKNFQVNILTNHITPKTPRSSRRQTRLALTAATIDQAARSVIEKAGFGEQFIHTTGHSLGLEIHEQPSISSMNNQELKAGMVITVEPGIYLPGEFGYRHENTILLKNI